MGLGRSADKLPKSRLPEREDGRQEGRKAANKETAQSADGDECDGFNAHVLLPFAYRTSLSVCTRHIQVVRGSLPYSFVM